MKKIFILLALTFSFIVTVNSQNFFGGLIAGGITSQVEGDQRGGFNKLGFTAGAFAGLPINKNFSVHLELKYIQKGSRSNNVEAFPDGDPYLLRLDYIDMPIVFTTNFNMIRINGRGLHWLNVELGLSVDVLAKYKEEIMGIENIDYNPWRRVALNVLAGIRINITKDCQIGLRTINSITSIRKNVVTGNVIRFNQWGEFNDVLQLAIFYRL